MYKITINFDNTESQVVVGESYRNLAEYLPSGKQIIVIADTNIIKYYGDFFHKWAVIEISSCEHNKTLDTVAHIYQCLLDNNADRSSFIVAVGGGIVCDVAGFAASTFMRGVPFGFVSTTLLSQVDASVGGKNGVNFAGYKNMAGTFNQPRFVLCDTEMLQTLPEREFISGFAEIVKAAAIRNAELFDYLEQNAEKAIARDPEVIRHLVIESVKIKADVVQQDEREQGLRRILNFGHTFGHAIEALTGFSHGEAVSIGMIIAAHLSIAKSAFPKSHLARLEKLLVRLELPVTTDAQPEAIFKALQKDKKREDSNIHFVTLEKIGNAIINSISLNELRSTSFKNN